MSAVLDRLTLVAPHFFRSNETPLPCFLHYSTKAVTAWR